MLEICRIFIYLLQI